MFLCTLSPGGSRGVRKGTSLKSPLKNVMPWSCKLTDPSAHSRRIIVVETSLNIVLQSSAVLAYLVRKGTVVVVVVVVVVVLKTMF